MAGQIVVLTLDAPPVDATDFVVEFSATARDPWTAYSPTSASPTGFTDPAALLAVGTLDLDNQLTLDGINGSGGNVVAATAPATFYRYRWFGPSGYGNPTRAPFRVNYPEPAITGTSYTAPTADDIRNRSGVNEAIDNLLAEELDAALMGLVADAEVRTALSVGTAVFDAADLTARQVRALQIAVSKRAGADYLRLIASKKVTGTQAPRGMEQAALLREQADALEAEAVNYDALAIGIVNEETQLGALRTGRILITEPNEYLDSYRPPWRLPDVLVLE
jgi:hypothetical protein